jgi:hypothetical protein
LLFDLDRHDCDQAGYTCQPREYRARARQTQRLWQKMCVGDETILLANATKMKEMMYAEKVQSVLSNVQTRAIPGQSLQTFATALLAQSVSQT